MGVCAPPISFASPLPNLPSKPNPPFVFLSRGAARTILAWSCVMFLLFDRAELGDICMSLNFGSSFFGVVVVQKAKPCTKDSIKYAIGIRARFPPKF